MSIALLLDVFLAGAAIAFVLYIFDLLVSIGGWFPLKTAPDAPSKNRFVLLVPAHNEESVIERTVRGITAQDYPQDLYRLVVVADNCAKEDRTADLARAAGAEVWERYDDDPAKRTKGHALQWAIERLKRDFDDQIDAFCVVDADNIVAPNFFSILNNCLENGEVAIQTYIDTKNPTDTWVTRSIALGYWISNRFWYRARAYWGLNTTLGGTGICLQWDVMKRHRWDTGCLTEDLDITMKLLMDEDTLVHFTEQTRIYDEKPTRIYASMVQRSRWMQGHHDVAWRYFVPTMWRGIRKMSIVHIDTALYLLAPIKTLIAAFCFAGVALIYGFLPRSQWPNDGELPYSILGLILFSLVFVVYPIILGFIERRYVRPVFDFPIFFFFAWSWIPAIIVGIFRMRNREWLHTHHERMASAHIRAQLLNASGEGEPVRDISLEPEKPLPIKTESR